MSAEFTEDAEQRIREIAIEVAVAMSRVQAARAAGEAIDRYRVSDSEVEEFLATPRQISGIGPRGV